LAAIIPSLELALNLVKGRKGKRVIKLINN
jgi:hypothetical protein